MLTRRIGAMELCLSRLAAIELVKKASKQVADNDVWAAIDTLNLSVSMLKKDHPSWAIDLRQVALGFAERMESPKRRVNLVLESERLELKAELLSQPKRPCGVLHVRRQLGLG